MVSPRRRVAHRGRAGDADGRRSRTGRLERCCLPETATDPGIGPLVATAIVASIGNGAAFRKGREFAAWMGLAPKQHSTGGKAKLYGISKRGNRYLRKILIHGARAAVLRSKRDRIVMGAWMTSLEMRAPRNVLIVATANKLARIAWAVLSTGQDYRALQDPVSA